jgi:geranylgeranyl diphosphate synthase type II
MSVFPDPGKPGPEESRFRRYLDRRAKLYDRTLGTLLPEGRLYPPVLHRAMRYATLGKAKRLRPVLAHLAFDALGGTGRRIVPVAASLELIHTFSLIHDDLPSMDDDDYRRGRLTTHRVFGEGIAVLAGDALLVEAYRILNDALRRPGVEPALLGEVLAEISSAIGTQGMIGGQVVDLTSEGKRVPIRTVDYIHTRKTGRLLAASLRVGGRLAGASPRQLLTLGRFGAKFGLAFQIVDDILNVTSSFRVLGKRTGGDEKRRKVTWPHVMGLPESHERVTELLGEARSIARGIGDWAPVFAGLCEYISRRRAGS